MAANEVCWFDSDDVGATTLNNAAGSLGAVLYSALVTGINPKSITSMSVASGIATAVCAGHGYTAAVGKSVEIAGAATGALNGRKQPLTVAAGSFTFDATGVADTGAVGGTITAKRSPIGWARVADSANKSIYARTDVAATAQVLCLDDTAAGVAGTTYARIVMAEAWTAADAFTGLAPTAAQLAGGQVVSKGANTAGAKKWAIFGDSRFLYLFTETTGYPFASNVGLSMSCFGDIVSDRAGDAYGSIISGAVATPGDLASGVAKSVSLSTAPSAYDLCFSRLSNQLGAAVRANVPGLFSGVVGASGPIYPSPVNNGAALQGPVLVAEESSAFVHPVRGALPGLYHPVCKGLNILHLTALQNVSGSARSLVVVGTNSQGTLGAVVIDTTGPWR